MMCFSFYILTVNGVEVFEGDRDECKKEAKKYDGVCSVEHVHYES